MNTDFKHFFQTAMGGDLSPYPYQSNLAKEPWPDVVEIPTGLGKTAGIVLSWIYKRLNGDLITPRRLVYCLPMRVLVEQTAINARKWVDRISESHLVPNDWNLNVYMLKGGDIENDWDKYPERDAIIVGTQDQLLSRALNRGYSMSRFRWPIDFGYLNNDCLWVLDEVQLMDIGLATTAQLQAFRKNMGTIAPVHSVWMSATLQKDWLGTVDFRPFTSKLTERKLSSKDYDQPSVIKRIKAKKVLEKVTLPHNKPGEFAQMVINAHKAGTRTLVVVNTVKRATELYQAIKRKKPKADLTLLHSRFRPIDRSRALDRVLAEPSSQGSICVSTQVVEAGVDISATTLITDLAPWASLVQRFGRCNRYGDDNNAKVIWVDIDLGKKGSALPYSEEELKQSASHLDGLTDVGVDYLPSVTSPMNFKHVIRSKDLIDLFDTTPDLSGMDIDISRFIRDSDDVDVQVFWRDSLPEGFAGEQPAPSHEELCSVPIKGLKAVTGINILSWDHLEKRWARPACIYPGMRLMLKVSAGCYCTELGWTGKKKDIPDHIDIGVNQNEGDDDDPHALTSRQTLLEHTDQVVGSLISILSKCDISSRELRESLITAAYWHDVGKAHPVFQTAVLGDDPPDDDASTLWAKSDSYRISYSRKGFRHELASGLAMLENDLPDLAAFLAAAHHGKVRLSIRSLPHEKLPDDPDIRFARGIWDGDILGEVELGGGHKMPPTTLDLSYMTIGDGPKGQSWISRVINLRDDVSVGPFRLAYLEGLLRSADWRASESAGDKVA